MNSVSVIIPVYNASSTIKKTLQSLIGQQKLINELIIINDGSSDNSIEIINKFFKKDFFSIKKQIINHPKSIGLSASYNDGINHSHGDLIITLHADVTLQKNALKLLLTPFSNPKTVATYHQVNHPISLWKKYNFWQQVFFDRQMGVTQSGLDGKFDCYRRQALLKVGLFDNKTFFRAGEDGDIFLKFQKIGQVVATKATIVHLHNIEPSFDYKKIIYKQAQYSQAQGALLKRHGPISIAHFFHTFFREILLTLIIIPYFNTISLILIFLYSIIYSRNTLRQNSHDIRILFLPLLNIYLLFVSFIYTLKGYFYGQQTI